ncbi:MAG: spore maturation protein [Clostridia bacterium]|nr:spore maturation protein [Clostridia bacterium]
MNKLPVFEIFLKGAKKALAVTADLLPALTALCLTVSMLSASGALEIPGRLLSPVAGLLGIPEEVLPLCIISPLSGSGSLSVLEEIFREFSPDSFTGRTASVIAGASETTFYAVAVYFGSVGITKTRHTIPAALAADITTYIAAAFFCRII